MAILAGERSWSASVSAVRELRIDIPHDLRERVRMFYVQLIGLPEWPPARQIPGGWCAGRPRRGVYFVYRHDVRADPLRRRMTIDVPCLDSVELRLREAAYPHLRERGLGLSDQRILVNDPAGYLVEVRELRQF